MSNIILNFRKNYLNEIIAVEYGLKKAARQFVADKDIPEYMKFIKNRNLQYSFLRDKNYFYISKSKEPAEKAMKVEIKLSKMNLNYHNFLEFSLLNKELGKLLGYPDCCIESYINCWRQFLLKKEKTTTSIKSSAQKEPNYVSDSYKNTKNKNKINFLLNNLSVYRLISFFPCSYECKKSLNFTIELFGNLSEEQRKLTEEALKRDLLVWNEEKMIGFDRRFRDNKVNYNPEKINLLGISEEMKKVLRKGNKFENSENYMKIFWDDNLIFRYRKKSPEECFALSFQ